MSKTALAPFLGCSAARGNGTTPPCRGTTGETNSVLTDVDRLSSTAAVMSRATVRGSGDPHDRVSHRNSKSFQRSGRRNRWPHFVCPSLSVMNTSLCRELLEQGCRGRSSTLHHATSFSGANTPGQGRLDLAHAAVAGEQLDPRNATSGVDLVLVFRRKTRNVSCLWRRGRVGNPFPDPADSVRKRSDNHFSPKLLGLAELETQEGESH